MTPFIIPTQPIAQTFNVSLGGTVYVITLRWGGPQSACWLMDVSDQNGNPLLNGIALVTGCDLLEQFSYLEIGGLGSQMTVQSTFDPDQVPDYGSLGSTGNLFFVTNP